MLFARFLLCVTISTTRAKNRIRIECFVTDTYSSLELGPEIIPFDYQGRICGSSSKTEICHESNKAEIKEKLQSFKMGSIERILPPGTD